jgi:hypothetical protein
MLGWNRAKKLQYVQCLGPTVGVNISSKNLNIPGARTVTSCGHIYPFLSVIQLSFRETLSLKLRRVRNSK